MKKKVLRVTVQLTSVRLVPLRRSGQSGLIGLFPTDVRTERIEWIHRDPILDQGNARIVRSHLRWIDDSNHSEASA